MRGDPGLTDAAFALNTDVIMQSGTSTSPYYHAAIGRALLLPATLVLVLS